MTKIVVRKASVKDAKRMAEIHVSAWRAAYAGIMTANYLANLKVSDREAMWKKEESTEFSWGGKLPCWG